MYRNRDQNRSNGRSTEPKRQSVTTNGGSSIDFRERQRRSESDRSFGTTSVDDGTDTEQRREFPTTVEFLLDRIVRLGRRARNPLETVLKGTRSSEGDGRETSRAHPAELLAPFVVSVMYVGVAVLVGPGLFDTAGPGASKIGAFVLLGVLLHLSGYSTLQLYTDAHRLSDRNRQWRPNPWLYICGGTLALVVLRIGELIVTGRTVSEPVIYLVGNVIVAIPLASIFAGPIYWWNRRRHTGSSNTSR